MRDQTPLSLMTSVVRRAFPALAILGWLIAGSLPARCAIFVSGEVLLQATHKPVSGAVVSLYKDAAKDPAAISQSLPNGGFILKLAQPGPYRLTVEHPQYVVGDQQLDVPAKGIDSLHILVLPRPVLHLQIFAKNGQLLREGQVVSSAQLSWPGGELSDHTDGTAGHDGSVTLPFSKFVPTDQVDRVLISVRAPQEGEAQLYLDKWPADPVTVKLELGKTIAGKVVDKDGNPIPNAPVGAVRLFNNGRFVSPEQYGITVTSTEGTFDIPQLWPGSYAVVIFAPDFQASPQLVVLTNAINRVNFTVARSAPVIAK